MINTRRMAAFALSAALCISLVPATAFAKSSSTKASQETTETSQSASVDAKTTTDTSTALDADAAADASATADNSTSSSSGADTSSSTPAATEETSAGAGEAADSTTATGTEGAVTESAENAEGADAASASDSKASTTKKKSKKKKKKKIVTYKPSAFVYKVRTGTKWCADTTKGKAAGTTTTRGTGIKVKYLLMKGSDGSTKKSRDFTVELNVDGKWVSVKAGKAYASKSKTIQGIKIKLSDELAKDYNVFYRVNVAHYEWLGWAKNGQATGTSGQEYSIRALKVSIKSINKPDKVSAKPLWVKRPTVKYSLGLTKTPSTLSKTKKNGGTAGKTSWNAKSDRLRVSLANTAFVGSIEYQVRTGKNNNTGWSSWKANGATAGKKKKKIQAIRIRLTGKLKKYYDVYYRVYSGDNHWLGWAKNGRTAGTGQIGYKVGAVQVKLVIKGGGAPGSTSSSYTTYGVPGKNAQLAMIRKAQKYYSNTSKLILVNRSTCRVAIFSGSHNNWKLEKYWSCCVGAPSTPTPGGQFTTSGEKVYSFGEEKGYSCYYGTVIYGDYMFHSTLYYANTRNPMDSRLGYHISHGCIRLAIDNAYWMYNNIYSGTKVVIY